MPVAFRLPQRLEAHEPPEARPPAGGPDATPFGPRAAVRLLVANRGDGRIVHARFHDLPAFLSAGDLLVVNASATLPAAIPARRTDGTPHLIHLATRAPGLPGDRWWMVEVRSQDGAHPVRGSRGPQGGESLALAGGGTVELIAPYARSGRLWLAHVRTDAPVIDHLGRHGRPIRYGYVARDWPLAAYQTTFAAVPGSAEMPSAGRPFTPRLVARLRGLGIGVAPIVLHTGVSSPERDEAPHPERYRVPAATAARVNAARARGGRVIAVGTTVVRALETVADPDGRVRAATGWTDLVVTADRGLSAVDGLVSGWHEPQASHLRLLEAAAGAELLERSYQAALAHGYLWHEFGDSHLIMP